MRNGHLLNTDQRSAWARIMRDTFRALITHCGGEDQIGETKRLICRRVAVLESELCFLEEDIARTRDRGRTPPDYKISLYGQLADRQRRLSDPLGWTRTPKDIGPSLDDLLRQSAVEQIAEARAREAQGCEIEVEVVPDTTQPAELTSEALNGSGDDQAVEGVAE
jgi:hypothetical protein